MNKKSVMIFLVLVLSISLISAGFWSDFMNEITGKNKVQMSPEEGLVAYYKLDGNANDEFGLHNGAQSGNVQYMVDGTENAAIFDGNASYITIGAGDDFSDVCDNGCTFCARVQFKDYKTNQGIIGRYSGSSADRFFLLYLNGVTQSVDFLTGQDGSSAGGAVASIAKNGIAPLSWNYFCGVYNGGTTKLGDRLIYLNGDLKDVSSSTYAHTINSTAWKDKERTYIGKYDESSSAKNYMNGAIGEVRIYNRALSEEEVLKLYTSAVGECSQDVVECADGSSVGRDPNNNCEFFACTESNQTNTCTDSDGGLDYYMNGKVEGFNGEVPVLYERGLEYSDGLIVTSSTTAVLKLNNNQMNVIEGNTYVFMDQAYLIVDIKYISQNNPNNSISLKLTASKDVCVNDIYLVEGYCSGNESAVKDYTCPNGCVDGACLLEPVQACSSLLDFMAAPKNLMVNGNNWELRYNDSWESYDGSSSYYVSFDYNEEDTYSYVWMNVWKSVDKEQTLRELENSLNHDLCNQRKLYLDDGSEQVVYVCKNIWRLAYDSQQLADDNDNYENDVVVLWFNGNVLVSMEVSNRNYDNCYSYLDCMAKEEERHRVQQRNLVEAVEKLIDNQEEYLSGFYIDYPANDLVEYFASMCVSQVEEETGYVGSWYCKTEPVICPPHGEQTQTCTRWNSLLEKDEKRESIMQCSPGICAGCYVPRWFEAVGNNKCIPYGFRFEQPTGWKIEDVLVSEKGSEGLSVEEANKNSDVDLKVYENNTALLTIETTQDAFKEIYLEIGKTYDWSQFIGEDEDSLNATVYVDSIVYDEFYYGNSEIEITFRISGWTTQKTIDTINAYCDIDGQMKEQKTIESNGDWASCQNSYECASNICSHGECAEPQAILSQVNGIAKFFYQLLCKIAHPVSEDEYNSCIANFLKVQ